MLSDSEVDVLLEGSTFGMEYDCPAADRTVTLPPGNRFCDRETSTHSILGVGTDPLGEFNLFSGEIQVRPCSSEGELLKEIDKVLRVACSSDQLGWHTSIHMHIKVPKLLDQVELLKCVLMYTSAHWHKLHPYLFQMEPHNEKYCNWVRNSAVEITGGVYDEAALARGAWAETPEDLALMLHLRHPGDDPDLWKDEFARDSRNVKRPAVNFSHLAMELKTIEFRAFTATYDRQILWNIIQLPAQWIRAALTNDPNPERLVQGKTWQTETTMTNNNPLVASRTSLYNHHRDAVIRNIEAQLISKALTVADLNCPTYWIEKGYQ